MVCFCHFLIKYAYVINMTESDSSNGYGQSIVWEDVEYSKNLYFKE